MNCCILKINWHDENLPVYSVDWQRYEVTGPLESINGEKNGENPTKTPEIKRLVTGGGDNHIRLWRLDDEWTVNYTDSNEEDNYGPRVTYLSTLVKHTQAVNAVKFSPQGLLASCSDDGSVIIWQKSPTLIKNIDNEFDDVESWTVVKLIRSNAEVVDLDWSPCGKYLVTGSMDNIVRVYDADSGNMIDHMTNHSHYVQGVSWDPKGEYIVSQSADKCMNVYKFKNGGTRLIYKNIRSEVPNYKLSEEDDGVVIGEKDGVEIISVDDDDKKEERGIKNKSLFHPETLQSFFRRLTFSPDGNLLVTPSGIFRYADGTETNTVYIFTRTNLNKPIVHLPGMSKPAVCISFSPALYKRQSTEPGVFDLPYKMIFAVATQDSVIIYDTEKLEPLAVVNNLHYSTITDMSWDGNKVIVSAADGFCSMIKFDNLGELDVITTDTITTNPITTNGNTTNPITTNPITTNTNISNTNNVNTNNTNTNLTNPGVIKEKINSIDNLIRKKSKNV